MVHGALGQADLWPLWMLNLTLPPPSSAFQGDPDRVAKAERAGEGHSAILTLPNLPKDSFPSGTGERGIPNLGSRWGLRSPRLRGWQKEAAGGAGK